MLKENNNLTPEEQTALEMHKQIVEKGLFNDIEPSREYMRGQKVVTVYDYYIFQIIGIKNQQVFLQCKIGNNFLRRRVNIQDIRPAEGYFEAIGCWENCINNKRLYKQL